MVEHHKSEATAQAGVHAVGLTVNAELGWIFREQPVSDYGIDAHIEVTEPDLSLKGRLLGDQIAPWGADLGKVYPGGLLEPRLTQSVCSS